MPRLSKIGAAALAAFGWTGLQTVTADYLVVAGGGGGGGTRAGGGGAGGYRTGTTALNLTASYTVTVGAGGAGGDGAAALSGANGSSSVFSTVTSAGGGGGAGANVGNGSAGGSGGGGCDNGTGGAGNTPSTSPSQGSNGGNGQESSPLVRAGGGGGGASAVGGNGSGNTPGNGGAGTASSISGASVTYAGGGAGGSYNGSTATGGTGGGGNTMVAGTPNTGGGGGAGTGNSASNYNGAQGGSGIVIISYTGPQQFGGGVVTSSGGKTIHTFTTSGTLSPLASLSASYLVVAGGGGGACLGGGGGAGGMQTGSSLTIDTNSIYAINVGAGGIGGTNGVDPTAGSNSSFSLVTASIGGGKGGGNWNVGNNGGNGGSGGGGGNGYGAGLTGGTGTAGQGNNGGTVASTASPYYSGSGGGAGAAGSGAATPNNGGIGLQSSITGTSTYYAGGGAGTGWSVSGGTAGTGGSGGGGNGTSSSTGGSGTANTGGGGGASGYPGASIFSAGGNGGSGIVIISYPGSTQQMAGGTVTVAGGNVIHTFTSSGYLSPIVTLNKSLRFRSSASAYLNRTPTAAGNRRTWTLSAWVKRGALGAYQRMFEARSSTGDSFIFNDNDTLNFWLNDASSANLTTTQVFRDPSAWYHLVLAVDTTQATASNRIKIYVNGTQITAFSSATYPSQNYDCHVNNTVVHNIGRHISSAIQYFDGYLADVNLIDGQALEPTSFGTMNDLGVWQPIRYGGSYGTNGFYLPFTNTTSTTTLVADSSPNGNNWTPNNISLTAGSTYDSMTDVPTNTSATVANYCVWFPQQGGQTWTYSNGNLQAQNGNGGSNAYSNIGTISVSTGKYYWEVQSLTAGPTSVRVPGVGIIDPTRNILDTASSVRPDVYLSGNGTIDNSSGSALQSGFSNMAANDIVGVAVDADAKTVQFYRNGLAVGTAQSYTASSVAPSVFSYSGYGFIANFGQRPFSYTPPSGFVALNTFNLPTPTIGATASSQANKYMDATLYTGNATIRNIVNAGGFQPDLVWIKERNGVGWNIFTDSLRGVTKNIYSNSTNAEATNNGTDITSFNSDGFGLGIDSNGDGVNRNGNTVVAWQWRASNATGVTNTAGSITSTVSANTTAGFSIVTYTGNGTSGATVGHGLGVAPSFIICKSRTQSAVDWPTYHISTGNNGGCTLNESLAKATASTWWNNTTPSSTVVTLGSGAQTNGNTQSMVMYCFAQVAGYSAFGSYTGNGSADGPFVFTGFRPKFLLVKRTDVGGSWYIWDTSRNSASGGNVMGYQLYPDLANAESGSGTDFDFLANGFKTRGNYTDINGNGGTYIYMAFAESPFKYANAR